jgi:hypothetical protein
MMDLSCRREDAVSQYKEALAVRDGEQDTRIAAERGLKKAYAPVQGHSCEADSSGDGAAGASADTASPATNSTSKPAAKPASGDLPVAQGKPGTTVLPTPVPDTTPSTPAPQP